MRTILAAILITATLATAAATCNEPLPAATPTTGQPAGTPTPYAAAMAPDGALPPLRAVVAEVAPAVVGVDVNSTALDFFLRPVEQHAAGSGVIFRSEGYIVTNDHVVNGANSIQVSLADGRVLPATIVGRDSRSDLAVIKIDAKGLPHLSFASEESIGVGDWVVAFGNALGLAGGPTVTVGIVSAIGRSVRTSSGTTLADLVQTDAAINEGNSGGPLVNLEGQVVGINTTILAEAQGIGFAINSATAERFTSDLIQFGRVRVPLLGLDGKTLTAAAAQQLGLSVTSGALITAVGDGPAQKAGVLAQDVITRFAGQTITGWDQFLGVLWSRRPGETVDMELLRDGQPMKLQVLLEERPNSG